MGELKSGGETEEDNSKKSPLITKRVNNQNENLDNTNSRCPETNISCAAIHQFLCDRILIIVIVALVVLSFSLVIGFAVLYSKPEGNCNCPENTTDPPYPEYDCNNKTLIPEAICQLPWPEVDKSFRLKELSEIKCLLPYKGEFLMKTNIYNNGKNTRIHVCQGGDSNDYYAYKLHVICDDHDIDGCIPACNVNCQRFEIRRKKPTTVVIVVDGSCLENGGQIEIWDIEIHGKRKRNANIFNRN